MLGTRMTVLGATRHIWPASSRKSRMHRWARGRSALWGAGGLFALLVSLLLSGCASAPLDYERAPSWAIKDTELTALGRSLEPLKAAHPGQSGFTLLNTGEDGFVSRIGLIEMAERSVDCQYYIWHNDVTGKLFWERLLRAADRGVRVRVLADDVHTAGRDFNIAAGDLHPNIEIRLFNPVTNRKRRILSMLGDVSRIKYRMHNKMFVVDNQVAILGGRNIGDEYFGVHPHINFRDLEVAAIGPIVSDISDGFDKYWNSDKAVPVSALVESPSEQEALEVRKATESFVAAQTDFPYRLPEGKQDASIQMNRLQYEWSWGEAKFVSDDPNKSETGSSVVRNHLWIAFRDTQNEILLCTPYAVPSHAAVWLTEQLMKRGPIAFRVLTNSLASNDVPAAHAGYAKYRKDLLRAGVEIYELRPDAASRDIQIAPSAESSILGLHAKYAIFDRKVAFIGSYNFDQLSIRLSSEQGLFIYSPELAQEMASLFDQDRRYENSWRVELNEVAGQNWGPGEVKSELVWITEEDGKEVRYDYDPGASFSQRVGASIFSLIPTYDLL